MLREKDTPLRLLTKWVKKISGCYEQLDHFIGEETWPLCFLPIGKTIEFLMNKGYRPMNAVKEASELTACYLWRKNKIIYQFDKELLEILFTQALEMEDNEMLPIELLLHIPYPAAYIKAPEIIKDYDGFFYWIEYDINKNVHELRIQFLSNDKLNTYPQMLDLVPDATVKDCFFYTFLRWDERLPDAFKHIKESILKAIQLILYLVAQDADISDNQPYRKQHKNYPILDTVKEIQSYSVGIRIGATIRKLKTKSFNGGVEGETGRSKRPHSRRGHWHHFWIGHKDSAERKLILKWIAPTYIHMEYESEEIVVYPVRN